MAEYVTQRPDTTGEFRAYGFKDIGVSDNGKWARIVLVGRDLKIVLVGRDLKTEMPIHLGADLVDKMLPSLTNLAAEAARRSTGKNIRDAFHIRKGAVHTAENGEVI